MKRFLFLFLILPLILGGCVQPQITPDLATFLEADKTNEIPYTDDFKCLDFAEELCLNAKEKGLKVGIVFVFFENSSKEKKYHALNVFDTDEGLVFIDCSTGRDAIVNVEIGKPYSTSYSKTTNEEYSATLSATSTLGKEVIDYIIVWDIEDI